MIGTNTTEKSTTGTIVPITRPSWDEYFLSFAILASFRSPDARTQCGCIFTKDNKILSVGYNGFPSKVDDKSLPNYDENKYQYMIHSEMNAIYNAAGPLKGAKAYISGPPCSECIKAMWQCGITDIHYCGWSKPKMEYDKEKRKKILELLGLRIRLVHHLVEYVDPQQFIVKHQSLENSCVTKQN